MTGLGDGRVAAQRSIVLFYLRLVSFRNGGKACGPLNLSDSGDARDDEDEDSSGR